MRIIRNSTTLLFHKILILKAQVSDGEINEFSLQILLRDGTNLQVFIVNIYVKETGLTHRI